MPPAKPASGGQQGRCAAGIVLATHEHGTETNGDRSMAHLGKLPQPAPQCFPPGVTDKQGKEAFVVRFGTATAEAIPTAKLPPHPTNGDERRYHDKSATYTKCPRPDRPGALTHQ